MGGFGSIEILLIMLVALIVFGAKRLPEIARGMGKGMSEFKKAARDIQNEINREIDHISLAKDIAEPLPPPTQELTGQQGESPYPGDQPDKAGEDKKDKQEEG